MSSFNKSFIKERIWNFQWKYERRSMNDDVRRVFRRNRFGDSSGALNPDPMMHSIIMRALHACDCVATAEDLKTRMGGVVVAYSYFTNRYGRGRRYIYGYSYTCHPSNTSQVHLQDLMWSLLNRFNGFLRNVSDWMEMASFFVHRWGALVFHRKAQDTTLIVSTLLQSKPYS